MSTQQVTLSAVTVNPDGSIEIAIDWDGFAFSKTFADGAALASANASLLASADEAHRWLVFYLLNLGATAETLGSYAGRKLVIEVRPAVQQTISLVSP
jgi:hypothetical protein